MVEQTTDREHVAWDIEITGFAYDDTTTVAGFWYPAGHADILVLPDRPGRTPRVSPSAPGRSAHPP
jgi:hypothetical protein